MELIIFLIIGAVAGFAAGLFGVGGGTIIVPLLFIVFTQMDYSPDTVMHLALGTSLATIIVTSISSLMAHNKKGAVMWPVFKNLTPGMAIGCFFGAGIAGALSGTHLQLIVGTFLLWVAFNMFTGGKKRLATDVSTADTVLPSTPKQLVAGAGIGVASAIFGIGGGSLTVPYLTRYGVVMQKAVGTSAACGLPIAMLAHLVYGLWNERSRRDSQCGWLCTHLCIFGDQHHELFYRKSGCKSRASIIANIIKKMLFGTAYDGELLFLI